MADFPLCAACRSEYDDPADRRFHAETICCPDCGPTLALRPAARRATRTGAERSRAARRLLADGGVLAVKGIGGYHLACDATNADAVATLRKRKQRGGKPFALMVRDLATAAAARLPDRRGGDLLTGFAHPIVLARGTS